jgi:DNA-binding response OmpR family regulator
MSTATAALLLAEHEPETCGLLERHLAEDGFAVVRASDSGEVLNLAETARPDLVLLGAALPGSTAVELCRRLREGEPGRTWDRHVPLIVLGTDEADATDRVRAFDRGADDYVGRPFVYEELRARIPAVLRRAMPPPDPIRTDAAEIRVDLATRRVTVRETRVAVSGKEYELLLKLMSDPTRVFRKEELLRDVWGYRSIGRTRTLDSHASRLRRKLNAVGTDERYVLNVWGVGYRLMDG